jgi:GNAT superfamily N-acetyltransferase
MLEPSADAAHAIAAVRRHHALDPGGCLIAEVAGEHAGAGFVRRYDGVAVLGPVVVADRWQAQGIGKRLVERLLELVEDTTPVGGRVDAWNARALGIAVACGLEARDAVLHMIALGGLRGPGRATALGGAPTTELTDGDLEAVARYDAAHVGASRRTDLGALCAAGAVGLVGRDDAGQVRGYLLGRLEGNLARIGPGVADSPELMATLVARLGERLGPEAHIQQIGLPASSATLAGRALGMGFRGTGTALEMWRGRLPAFEHPGKRVRVVGTPPDAL